MKKWFLIFMGVAALGGAGFVYYDLHLPFRGYNDSRVLTIDPGMRAPEVTELLIDRGVIRYRLPFLILEVAGRPRRHFIKAGEYLFDRPLTPIEVYQKLVRGDVYMRTVLIPEGSDRFDIARILEEQLGISPVDFLRATQITAPVGDLDPQAPSLEGFLFPDTYRLPYGASASIVVTTMLARFRHVLDSRFPDLRHSPDKLHDVLTLASLVEKETPQAAERPMVAGVFERRLEKSMHLQCDPTVVYAARLDRLVSASIEGVMNLNLVAPVSDPITRRELSLESPYNTYQQAGLPRGPICSPGESAIRAALNPATGDSLYFVADNHGGHFFASTLAQHNRNVARYRRESEASGEAAPEQQSTRPDSALGSPAGHVQNQTEDQTGAGQQAPGQTPSAVAGQAQPSPAGTAGAAEPSNQAGSTTTQHSGRHRGRHKRRTLHKQEAAHPGISGGARAGSRRNAGDSGH